MWQQKAEFQDCQLAAMVHIGEPLQLARIRCLPQIVLPRGAVFSPWVKTQTEEELEP